MSDFHSTPQSFRHVNLPVQVALDIAYDFAKRPGADVELHVFIDLTHATPLRCQILAQEITPEQHRIELQRSFGREIALSQSLEEFCNLYQKFS